MGSPFHSKAFRKLAREWDQRLAASGFVDVERDDGSLVYGGAALRRGARRAARSGRAAYYQRAGSWLHDRVFRTRTQRRVWELHSEGASMRDIRIALGPMRMRQLRRILEVIKRERAALSLHLANLPVEPYEAPSLHQQHLDAEGYSAGSYDDGSAGEGDPMRRIHRAFQRRESGHLLAEQGLSGLMVQRRFWT